MNSILTATYWEIGRRIVEFEQGGLARAEYGEQLLPRLSKDLTRRHGRGFGLSNLKTIRRFHWVYRERGKGQTLTGQSRGPSDAFALSWSHYVHISALEESAQRDFYEKRADLEGWTVRDLARQIDSMLFERTRHPHEGRSERHSCRRSGRRLSPEAAIKDPYVLEFLGGGALKSEQRLESTLIEHLADFMLELGYGFTFVARQKRLQIGTDAHYLDLLFYHRGLRCLVAIDLKLRKFVPADAGQMNAYLNCLREEDAFAGEAPPIGLILCTGKNETVARYALGGLTNRIFASRYRLQLPDPALLTSEIDLHRRLPPPRRAPNRSRRTHGELADAIGRKRTDCTRVFLPPAPPT